MPTYTNPVYDTYFADPFVLRHEGAYYGFGTASPDVRALPALRSPDLVAWEPIGDVLEPPELDAEAFWAPEVAYRDGVFWMYYSAGGAEGEGQQLRVARSERPEGPFVDAGAVLDPDDPFTIDAHPFQDEDGQWYLFYCRDFLDGERVGTGVVVDRLPEVDALAGDRRLVVRPYAEWNLFTADRDWYGRRWDAWYTVEGPFVRKHEGRYYCFFSGGNWQQPSYGISYAVAEHPLGPYRVAPGEGPTVLRTAPGRVLGPGHASIVESPSGAEELLVYHGWDPEASARLMRIDRLRWTSDGPRCDGPTTTPQPAPG